MKLLNSLLKYAAPLILLLVFCTGVYAYEVSQTSGGLDIKWTASDVSYSVNSSGGPSNNLAAIQAAMQTWSDVTTSVFTFRYIGTTTSTAYAVNDGHNIVCFGSMGTSGILAENTYWYVPSTGNIVDSDIEFNTDYAWSANGLAGTFDVQDVGTHELGHSLSLKDLYSAADSEKTMYGYSAAGETKKRTLDQDDINGIAYLYPDGTPPSGTISVNAGAGYTTSASVTLALSCTDNGGSCSQMRFSNDNATWSAPEAYATHKSWSLPPGDGLKTVYVRYSDSAGNWSVAYNDAIALDTADPVTTASPPGGAFSSAQNVTLSCDDSTGSGCVNIYYTTDGSDPTTGSPVYAGAIGISSNTVLKFFSADGAGNHESIKTETYVINIAGALDITTSSLASAMVGDAYSQTLSAAYGTSPYTWSISAGALPSGLTLNSSAGEIAGTPDTAGIFAFTVLVTDADTSSAMKNLSITVQSYSVKIGSTFYSTLQNAYDSSVPGDTIEILGADFYEDFICDRNLSVLLKGGYDAGFTSNPTYTAINGTMTISNGIVEVENVIIK